MTGDEQFEVVWGLCAARLLLRYEMESNSDIAELLEGRDYQAESPAGAAIWLAIDAVAQEPSFADEYHQRYIELTEDLAFSAAVEGFQQVIDRYWPQIKSDADRRLGRADDSHE